MTQNSCLQWSNIALAACVHLCISVSVALFQEQDEEHGF